jgi:hypothetical protein
MSEWRDIDTAPKDGETPVLTYRTVGCMSVAIYWPHGNAEWCAVDGVHLLNVTHWQPLPAPPTTKHGEGS